MQDGSSCRRAVLVRPVCVSSRAFFTDRGLLSRHPPAQHVHTLAGVPVKYPVGLKRAVRAGHNAAEVVLGRDHAMIVRLNGAKLTS